jgi:hypothetical protein
MKVTKFIQDDTGKVIGYEDPTPTKLSSLPKLNAFYGCVNIDVMSLCDINSWFFMGNEFADFPSKVLVMQGDIVCMVFDSSSTPFANAPALKEIWINPRALIIDRFLFANMEGEVNVYFYNHTYEELVEMNGGDSDWFTHAGENVHIYFKNTMPADVEWPEEIKPAT